MFVLCVCFFAVTVRIDFVLFIPRIIDNCFTTLNQQSAYIFSLDIYHVTLNIPMGFDSQGIFIRESNQSSTLLHRVSCVQKWLIWFSVVLLQFEFLMTVPCGSKNVGFWGVIL